MSKLEGWGFLALMGGLMGVTLSLSLLEGNAQIAGLLISVMTIVLSGGLYGASVRRARTDDEEVSP